MTTTVYVVRHAESESNRDGVFAGAADPPLTDLGRRQARALASRLSSVTLDSIISSDLARSRETAEAVVAGRDLPLRCDARLREMHYGEWEGLTGEVVKNRYQDQWQALLNPTADFHPPGGESLAELRLRMLAVYSEVVSDQVDRSTLLVTHGNAAQALVAALLDLPYSASWRLKIANVGLTRIDHFGETPVLVLLNDTSHLDTP